MKVAWPRGSSVLRRPGVRQGGPDRDACVLGLSPRSRVDGIADEGWGA